MRRQRRFTAVEAAARLQQLLSDSDASDTDSSVVSSDEIPAGEEVGLQDSQAAILSDEELSQEPHSSVGENFENSENVRHEQSGSGDNTRNTTDVFRASSGREWNKNPPPTSRTRRANLFTSTPGFSVHISTAKEALDEFLTEKMLQEIVECTNRYGHANSNTWSDITILELTAWIGLLLLAGVSKGNHENIREMWKDGPLSRPMSRATMSVNRFEEIRRCIRFDDKDTRSERAENGDKLAAIREIWTQFIERCRSIYEPNELLCIDEQLIPFRGRCSFKQYLPSKPDKYGMKIFLIVDCLTGYVCDGIPYIGKEGINEGLRSKGLAKNVVIKFCERFFQSGRNITCDNFFTDFSLAEELYMKHLTIVGTVRKNKADLPREFVDCKKREVGSTLFGFDKNTTILSHVPKKNKCVTLLSTMHHEGKLDENSHKPDIILFYNSTKGAVDTVDQLSHSYSIQRKTKRWPLAFFTNMVNLAAINAFILFREQQSDQILKVSHRRRVFLQDLGKEMVTPLIKIRAKSLNGMTIPIQNAIKACNLMPKATASQQSDDGQKTLKAKRKRCYRCIQVREDRKSSRICNKCGQCVCAEHSKKEEFFYCKRPRCT